MPSIKDFDKKKKKSSKKVNSSESAVPVDSQGWHASDTRPVKKRRPSKIDSENAEPVVEVENYSEAASEAVKDEAAPESFQSFSEPPKFGLEFPGSFLVKAKIPKAFDLAEKIAGEWVNDGKFEALPVGHPLAQILASKALLKAKSLEKNVLNSTAITLAKIGFEYAKSKIKR